MDPDICFYKVEDNDKSDSGDDVVIHVKNDKYSTDTNQNINNLNLLVIKYFDHQIPKIVSVLRRIMVRLFEHLGITTWKGIYQRWVFVDNYLKETSLIKFRNFVLSCKEIARDEAIYQWGLGEQDDVCSENFWALCNTKGIGCDNGDITSKGR